MKNKQKSILRICILHLSVFSLIIIAFFFTAKQISDLSFQNAIPIIDDIMQYETKLKTEDYSSIPIKKIKNSSFAVFDENDRLLYYSSDELKNIFDNDEIRFASDTYNQIWFTVSAITENDKKGYIITKLQYNFYDDIDEIISYCIIDDDYNIIEGDLFSDKKQLTQEEFEILSNDTLSNKKLIEKATFVTDSGQQRSLALVTPAGDQKFYKNAQQKAQLIWILMVPLMLLLIIIETKLFVSHIKKTFYPLDEAVRAFEINKQFKIDSDDVPKELESFVYDFTELIDILNYEKDKNEASYKEKQRVFANLSHDLRTPLTVIQGYSKAFIDGMVPEEKTKQYMTAIYNKVTDAANTMDSLYEYSQLEHPDYQIKIQTDNLCEFCKEYLAEKYNEIELNGFILDFSIPEKSISFSFDRVLMKRLFDNIIGNSIKYNEAGTTIYFSLTEKANEIILSLGDNGVGMPDNIRENAFRPFVIGDEARTNNKGTGLGLTISKSIVNRHKGKIKFVYPPNPPYKTQFYITFRK